MFKLVANIDSCINNILAEQNGYERNGDIFINYILTERREINNFRSHNVKHITSFNYIVWTKLFSYTST